MTVARWNAFRAAKNSKTHNVVCRCTTERRLSSLNQRCIHLSSARLQEEQTKQRKSPKSPSDGGPDDSPPPKPKDPSFYGSASRRAGRNIKRVKELPQVFIPPWFPERNVVLADDSKSQPDASSASVIANEPAEDRGSGIAADGSPDVPLEEQISNPVDQPSTKSPQSYLTQNLTLNKHVVEEVHSLFQAGLHVPDSQSSDFVSSIKPHLVLSCPRRGAFSYLEAFVQDIAAQLNADSVRITAQDIAEIGGDYIDDPSSFRPSTLSSLGYDVAQVGAITPRPASEISQEQDEYEEGEEEPDYSHQAGPRQFPQQHGFFGSNISVVPSFIGAFKLDDLMKGFANAKEVPAEGTEQQPNTANGKQVMQMRDNTLEMKMSMLVETLLNVPELKRSTEGVPSQVRLISGTAIDDPTLQTFQLQRGSNGLVVLVEDYHTIGMTRHGAKFIDKLHEVADMRRKEGQPVLIVGTASSEKPLAPGDHKTAVDDVQTQPFGLVRNVVLPVRDKSDDGLLLAEHKRKIKESNLRHLRTMLRKTAPQQEQVVPVVYDWDLDIESKWAFISGLERSIWPLDKVNRIATVARGLMDKSDKMSAKDIENALGIIDASDSSKYRWYKKQSEKKFKIVEDTLSTADDSKNDSIEEKMQKLRKKCNSYEKKLLNGVVDPKHIKTTFSDVRAPMETIEALKTLTSLSLVRPDAFTYGVLATDRIPGLLLYGPPGTGKTLLAKAVAKESNATVLEVSGSDVYDMYVGEGEKNVRAIFTLAKKLSPCIVFIDEADAMLGSRSGGQSRTSHRELINQFLREWDGMTDMSAFIMVATNRPFDLDEASLRRLPRRLLVDLPIEKDREEILRIHLKDEILDAEVSVPQLASQTPFYSGSDLKNLCVAAALACVREEFDTATAHNLDDPGEKYHYPEKRTLFQRHFTKAMEEISASISEDMGSLSAIRKFDEKYGDRRGRRKKLGGYGFKTVDDSEKLGSDAARVRNQT